MSWIRCENIVKKFGSRHALQGVSFEISQGEMVAILGPNGAGKSTLIQILLGLKAPTSGRVSIAGLSPGDPALLKRMGVTPQELSFAPHLKVRELLQWVAKIYGESVPENFIESFGLQDFYHQQAGALSGGQMRRLGLALAFVGKPDLVILDEPTTGLDVEGKMQMWQHLENFQRAGGTLILTTHDLYELSRLHCRMLMVDQGKIVRDGSVDELMARCEYKRVSFQKVPALQLQTSVQVEEVYNRSICWTLHAEDLLHELVQKNIPMKDLQVEVGNIEDVFRLLRGPE